MSPYPSSVLRCLIKQYLSLSSSGGCCGFIDFSKAFDNVNRETLFKTLKQFQISSKFLNLIQNMYSKLKCQVRTSSDESEMFPQSNGVMQGECLSPTLFTAYINKIERLMNDVDEMGVYRNGVKVSVIIGHIGQTATDGAWYSTTALLSGSDRPRRLCVLRLSGSEPQTRRTGA